MKITTGKRTTLAEGVAQVSSATHSIIDNESGPIKEVTFVVESKKSEKVDVTITVDELKAALEFIERCGG